MRRTYILGVLLISTLAMAESAAPDATPASNRSYSYVDASAPPGGNGWTFETAYRFLQDAIANAPQGSRIFVAQGVYRPDQSEEHPEGTGDRDATFELGPQRDLVGGFAGIAGEDPEENDPDRYVTILSGDLAGDDDLPDGSRADNARHVVTVELDAGGGFSLGKVAIRGGTTEAPCCGEGYYGAGIVHMGGVLYLEQCIIEDNEAPSGAGIYVDGDLSKLIMTDCLIAGNRATARGGGLSVHRADAGRIASCVFLGNHASVGGAVDGARGIVEDCWFLGNSADSHGGAIRGSAPVVDSVFSGNHSSSGGALDGSPPLIDRCTFALNHADYAGGALRTSGDVRVQSSIFWGNSAGTFDDQISSDDTTVTWSCVEGLSPETGGLHNHGLDPQFADPLGPDGIAGTLDDNLRLMPGSPCINAGDPGPVSYAERDAVGAPRFRVCRVDMGALESDEPGADCNDNGIADACDVAHGLSEDCNGNGVPDTCDIRSGDSSDCNVNDVPDECEAFVAYERAYGPDDLVPDVNIRHYVVSAPPAAADVELTFWASAGLAGPSRYIDVRFDGHSIGRIFETNATDCADPPDEATLSVPMDLYNDAVLGGRSVVIELQPHSIHNVCVPSRVLMRLRAVVSFGSNDVNRNGLPDECDCPADQNRDGQVGMADFLVVLATWGPAGEGGIGDIDRDGSVGMSDMLMVLLNWGQCVSS